MNSAFHTNKQQISRFDICTGFQDFLKIKKKRKFSLKTIPY